MQQSVKSVLHAAAELAAQLGLKVLCRVGVVPVGLPQLLRRVLVRDLLRRRADLGSAMRSGRGEGGLG